MAPINLKSLVGRLNDTSRRALEAAAGLCLSRTHYNVEVEHWLLKLVESQGGDIPAILRRFEIDAGRVSADLTRAIERLKTGNSRPPALSPAVVDLAREAWLAASLEFEAARARSGHVLYALLANEPLARQIQEACESFEAISLETLRREFSDIVASSSEVDAVSTPGKSGDGPDGRPRGPTKTPSLDQFTIDLTARARAGEIDPVLGRDGEIRQVIDILTRRRQNNPILTGEAGVGKTAVAEGFALRIVSGDVPTPLRNVAVRTLDLALLQAGAGVKGEFENRLKSVIAEVKASPQPIILFIDEAHTLIGAGGQAGQGDAANLIKPALARGELRTIAATTWAEYKKYFERDAALARRFQVVKVEEPEEAVAVGIMRGLVSIMERHHGVRVLDEAVVDSVRLSSRYISGRQLPDKSVSLLDTACARVALSQSATPAAIEDCRRRSELLAVSIGILRREHATSAAHAERLAELEREKAAAEDEGAGLEDRWQREKELVNEMREIRRKLEDSAAAAHADADAAKGAPTTAAALAQKSAQATAPATASKSATVPTGAAVPTGATVPKGAAVPASATSATSAAVPTGATVSPGAAKGSAAGAGAPPAQPLSEAEARLLRTDLEQRTSELAALQGETALVRVCVDSQAIAEVVSNWTGIPVGRMVKDQIQTVLELEKALAERIVGQSHALAALAQSIRTSRANLTDPKRPIGVFMLVGTSGVGKTETAIALAELLYGGEQNMTVINMSEFKEEHKVSLLMGSPPGYVGYGEGGVLTEAVRRKPYSVLLLDELEKAHPGVQDVFYQVFDKGNMRDGEGRDIDFRNTVILMTTNAGTEAIVSLCADPETMPDAEGLREALRPELLKTFKPAFLGRVTILPYFPLSDEVMKRIIRLKLDRIGRRVADNHRAEFSYTDELVDGIAARCTEVESGARNVDHILSRTLLPEMATEFLASMADGRALQSVRVSIDPSGRFQYALAHR